MQALCLFTNTDTVIGKPFQAVMLTLTYDRFYVGINDQKDFQVEFVT